MAEEQVNDTQDPMEEITDVWHKTENWFEENKQKVAVGGGALALIIVAVVFIFAKWLPDRNLKAQRDMYMAEMAFAKDSFDLALNGNGLNKGFIEIQKKYSFTKAANLCNYYIGISYLNKKDYAKAVDYLGSFSTSDPLLGAAKLNAIGDAYAEQKKTDDATSYYKKAAEFSDNDQFTPYYLLKLGMYYETQKKYNDAKEAYTKLKEKYPNTQEGREVEKYLARVAVEG
jgi:tetratricopeptide (TPR) repeat protein